MDVICHLVKSRWNPQTPVTNGDSIRTIVEFPMMDNFNEFVLSLKENCFKLIVWENEYNAVVYQPTPNTQSLKLNISDVNFPVVVSLLMEVYAPISAMADMVNAETLLIKT